MQKAVAIFFAYCRGTFSYSTTSAIFFGDKPIYRDHAVAMLDEQVYWQVIADAGLR